MCSIYQSGAEPLYYIPGCVSFVACSFLVLVGSSYVRLFEDGRILYFGVNLSTLPQAPPEAFVIIATCYVPRIRQTGTICYDLESDAKPV